MHVLLFSLQKELFGISVMNVLRVINLEKLIKIPKAPVYIAGVTNFEGNVIPVIDLASKIELGKTDLSATSKVVILEVYHGEDSIEVGVLIDEVLDVVQIEAVRLLPPPLENMGFNTNTLSGIYKVEEHFYMILSAGKIFEKELVSLVH
nr:chemotaxis protein CheW [Cesiribacter sp. SM1]